MAIAQSLPRVQTTRFWSIRNWRIGPKLLVAFLSAVLVPLAITSIIAVQTSRDALLSQGTTSLIVDGTNTANDIDLYLLGHRDDIVAVSKLTTLATLLANPKDSAAANSALRELQAMANRPDYESIAIMDRTGSIILSTSESDLGSSLEFADYTESAMRRDVYISTFSVSAVTNRPAIFFSAPVYNDAGQFLGAVRSRVGIDGIWRMIERDKDAAGRGTTGILLDENGIRIGETSSAGNRAAFENNLLFRPVAPVPDSAKLQLVTDNRFGVATAALLTAVPLPDVAQALKDPNIKTFETGADNSSERNFASISTLRTKMWHYVLMTPMSTFTGAADNLRLYFLAVAIVVALLTVVFVYIMARSFTRPIVELTRIADRISLGELNAKINIQQKDEIGELAEAVTRMQASLEGAINRLRTRRGATK